MKFFIVILLSINVAFGNCELMSYHYHTIAKYDKKLIGQKYNIVEVKFVDGGLFKLDKIDYDANFSSLIPTKILIENKEFKQTTNAESDSRFFTFDPLLPDDPSKALILADYQDKFGTVYFTKEVNQTIEELTLDDKLNQKILNLIENEQEFTIYGEKNYEWPPIIKSIEEISIEKSDIKLVRTKLEFKLTKNAVFYKNYNSSEDEKIYASRMELEVSFFKKNEVLWYIGNSGGEPCGLGGYLWEENITDGLYVQKHHFQLTAFYPNFSKNSDVFIFEGEPGILYFAEFGKNLIILKNLTYR